MAKISKQNVSTVPGTGTAMFALSFPAHLKYDVISATLHAEQEPGNVARLDPHGDVKIQPHAELPESADAAAFRPEKVPVLHLLRAGQHKAVLLPFA